MIQAEFLHGLHFRVQGIILDGCVLLQAHQARTKELLAVGGVAIIQQAQHFAHTHLAIRAALQTARLKHVQSKFIQFFGQEMGANQSGDTAIMQFGANLGQLTDWSAWLVLDIHKQGDLERTSALGFSHWPS